MQGLKQLNLNWGLPYPRKPRPKYQNKAAIRPEKGIVSTQAQTMREAIPQRTAETRRDRPTPTMAPVIVWVVETGMPNHVARNSAIAPEVCAQNPPEGLIRVIPMPIVLTMRQPPNKVPSAMAIWQDNTTQNGI